MSSKNYLDKNGLTYFWGKVKAYVDNLVAIAEDDEEILNLLTEYGYYAPVADVDGNVVTDIDNNIILG